MSEQVSSTSKSGERRDEEQESSQPVEPGVAQQPSEEQPQQEEPPNETHDIAPGQEREDEGAPEAQNEGLKAILLEFSQTKTGGKRGDGPDVRGEILSNLEPIQVPEAAGLGVRCIGSEPEDLGSSLWDEELLKVSQGDGQRTKESWIREKREKEPGGITW
ncbi:P antigen family member 3-like [Eulemur rufifrons]|uniref:P antigen family member 3-like n=1 Tax=Eulemur rufifrons TaxID=859984 RepID=UPI0037429DF7